MKLLISQDIIKNFPEMRIAIIIADHLRISKTNQDLQDLKLKTELEAKKKLSLEALTRHPHIIAWREAYRQFGVSAKKHPPSVESLLRRVLKGYSLPTINTLVDSYLLVELEYIIPFGGYDISRIVGDIYLEYAKGGESFTPLGLPEHKEQILPGEIVYRDFEKILTRRWNYKDCDEAKITLQTTQAILFAEAPDNRVSTTILEKASERLSELIKKYNEGKVKCFLFEPKKKPIFNLYFP